MSVDALELALLGGVAASPEGLPRERLVDMLVDEGMEHGRVNETVARLEAQGAFLGRGGRMRLSPRGVAAMPKPRSDLVPPARVAHRSAPPRPYFAMTMSIPWAVSVVSLASPAPKVAVPSKSPVT